MAFSASSSQQQIRKIPPSIPSAAGGRILKNTLMCGLIGSFLYLQYSYFTATSSRVLSNIKETTITTTEGIISSSSATTRVDPNNNTSVHDNDNDYDDNSNSTRIIDHTVLMGQFNFAPTNLTDIVFWHDTWKKWFHHIVIYGPFSDEDLMELHEAGIDAYLTSRDDKGYSSPMKNMAKTLSSYKMERQIKGVLYIHDDTLLNITNIPLLGSDTIIASSDVTNPRDAMKKNRTAREAIAQTCYSIQRDGSLTKANGFKSRDPMELIKSMNPPWRWRECVTRLYFLAVSDSRANMFREENGSFLVPTPSFGGSDFLYVPTALADTFDRAAELFFRHNVFLECGFPKIVDILQQQANATAVSVPLCSKFLASRGKFKMLTQCDDFPVAVVHPFKIGVQGYKNWTHAFRWITTSAEPFKNYEEARPNWAVY